MILYALFQAILGVEINVCTNILVPYIQTFWWDESLGDFGLIKLYSWFKSWHLLGIS